MPKCQNMAQIEGQRKCFTLSTIKVFVTATNHSEMVKLVSHALGDKCSKTP